jgi:hypothetical protein
MGDAIWFRVQPGASKVLAWRRAVRFQQAITLFCPFSPFHLFTNLLADLDCGDYFFHVLQFLSFPVAASQVPVSFYVHKDMDVFSSVFRSLSFNHNHHFDPWWASFGSSPLLPEVHISQPYQRFNGY